MEKVTIIGGGVAGLSCLNALADLGIKARLMEGGAIGTPKMCGEFLAPNAAQQLLKWDIGPLNPLQHAEFSNGKRSVAFSFPRSPIAFSREVAEHQLAKRARDLGAIIVENNSLVSLLVKEKNKPYYLQFSSGEELTSESIIIATGRMPWVKKPKHFPYWGIKFHFPSVLKPQMLQMFCAPNAYLGIVPLSDTQSNCACLIKNASLQKDDITPEYIKWLFSAHTELVALLDHHLHDETYSLVAQAPEFGLKNNPTWPDAYWIGDAVASLHPAIGSGFSHSIETALSASQCWMQGKSDYHASRSRAYAKQLLFYSKMLHHIFLKPKLNHFVQPIVAAFPQWINLLLAKIHF